MIGNKITLKYTKLKDDSFIYHTILFGVKITLSRALVQRLRDANALKEEIAIGDDWLLTAQQVSKGDKTYTNFYFTIPKSKAAEAPATGGEPIPF